MHAVNPWFTFVIFLRVRSQQERTITTLDGFIFPQPTPFKVGGGHFGAIGGSPAESVAMAEEASQEGIYELLPRAVWIIYGCLAHFGRAANVCVLIKLNRLWSV